MLSHLPLLTNPQHLEGFLLSAQRDALNVQLQGNSAQLRAVVKVIHPQLPQAAKAQGQTRGLVWVLPGSSGIGPQDGSSLDRHGLQGT